MFGRGSNAEAKLNKEKTEMKKLITALGAVMFAFGVHAAAVDWHFSASAIDVNFEDLAGTITLYFNDAYIGTATMENGGAETDVVVDTAGGTVKAVAEVTNFADGAGTLEYTYVISSLPMPGYADIESSLAAVSDSIGAGITNDYNIDISQTVADNGYSPVGPTPPVIPEPTTGLLVLLGIAGLALKRKQA